MIEAYNNPKINVNRGPDREKAGLTKIDEYNEELLQGGSYRLIKAEAGGKHRYNFIYEVDALLRDILRLRVRFISVYFLFRSKTHRTQTLDRVSSEITKLQPILPGHGVKESEE